MADTVQYLLEEMVPELEDLEKKGYFSQTEVKVIMKKRQDFEYALKRRATLKQDYLRYIDYEIKLEELRKCRKKLRKIKEKKSKGPAEIGITRRIHFIYERATRKFKSDLSLWRDWIRYCKRAKSYRQLSKVFVKALHRHADVAELWIDAAKWEFEQNANMTAARSLMQQALRLCKENTLIWHEYFRLELLCASKLMARQEVLGILPEQNDDEEAEEGDAEAKRQGATEALMRGAIARVVFQQAVAKFPQDLTFHATFARITRDIKFLGQAELLDVIYRTVAAAFSSVPEASDFLARRHAPTDAIALGAGVPYARPKEPQPFNVGEHAKADAAFLAAEKILVPSHHDVSSASTKSPGKKAKKGAAVNKKEDEESTVAAPAPHADVASLAKLYELHARYLAEVLSYALEFEASATTAEQVANQLFRTFRSAHAKSAASAALYLLWAQWADKLGQAKVAAAALQNACSRHGASAAPWVALVRRLLRESGAAEVPALIREAAERLDDSALRSFAREVRGAVPPPAIQVLDELGKRRGILLLAPLAA